MFQYANLTSVVQLVCTCIKKKTLHPGGAYGDDAHVSILLVQITIYLKEFMRLGTMRALACLHALQPVKIIMYEILMNNGNALLTSRQPKAYQLKS